MKPSLFSTLVFLAAVSATGAHADTSPGYVCLGRILHPHRAPEPLEIRVNEMRILRDGIVASARFALHQPLYATWLEDRAELRLLPVPGGGHQFHLDSRGDQLHLEIPNGGHKAGGDTKFGLWKGATLTGSCLWSKFVTIKD